jgi:hypothetical protein
MSNDHFVARTYLKRFGDAELGGMLHGYPKSGEAVFPCWPNDVCREWNGDINEAYLARTPDLLGQYRKIFEPPWSGAVKALESGPLSADHRFSIAGYVANLMTCTPGWRRIGVNLYDTHSVAFLSRAKARQEKYGGDPELPVEAIEMLERGELRLEHDPAFIKAVATQQLLKSAWIIYHQDWEVLRNTTEFPFVTSDNPVAMEEGRDLHLPTRFVAITPQLILLMQARRIQLPPIAPDKVPSLGSLSRRSVQPAEARHLNRQIARCAEDVVFSSTRSASVEKMVRNAARFRLELDFVKFPAGEPDAVYHGSILRVRKRGR